MTIYTVLVEDLKCDTQVEVFSEREDAIQYAWEAARAKAPHPEQITIETVNEWEELYLEYSTQGDYVRVERKRLR